LAPPKGKPERECGHRSALQVCPPSAERKRYVPVSAPVTGVGVEGEVSAGSFATTNKTEPPGEERICAGAFAAPHIVKSGPLISCHFVRLPVACQASKGDFAVERSNDVVSA
jgi:hypothetical protein